MGDGRHGGMSKPNWKGIQPPEEWSERGYDPMGRHNVPSGDPTRWGTRINQLLHNPVDAPTVTAILESDTIIRTQTHDQYPRPWMFVGNLSATNEVWALDAATWKAWLEITQGGGQTQFKHLADIRALVALAAPFYAPVVEGTKISRPFFVNPGAVVGSNVFARVIQVFVDSPVFEVTIDTALVTSPISAGWGL